MKLIDSGTGKAVYELPKQPERCEQVPPIEERPCFHIFASFFEHGGRKFHPGVWYFGFKSSKDGDKLPIETWICSPLYIEAVTRDDQSNNYGRLLRFVNTDGKERLWAMPMALLKGYGEELRGQLLSMGVQIDPDAYKQLARYLQNRTPERKIFCATQTGWHGGNYVMPNKVIGPSAGDVIFQSGDVAQTDYGAGGTLEGWQAEIAALAVGNPLLTGGISAAFVGPLLKRVHSGNGGIHLVGRSSRGKTGAVIAACSVWGGGSFMRSWSTTANGLEGIAARHNDGLLALDEIGQCDGRAVGAILYSVGNGVGKQRSDRTGAARSVSKWNVFVVSSGEVTPTTKMEEEGKRVMAGQEVRLLSVSADRTHGAWDNLHGFGGGAVFTDAIKTASHKHYGHAGIAFLEKLTGDNRDLSAMLEQFKALPGFQIQNADGQEIRAAAQFALIAMAGELATEYDLTGWAEGTATEAAIILFKSWLEMRGRGTSEDMKILELLQNYIDRFGSSHFSDINENTKRFGDGGIPYEVPPARVPDRAGWYEQNENGDRTYLFTGTGLRKALNINDKDPAFKRALVVLDRAGVLPKQNAKGERAKTERTPEGPKKLYRINPALLNSGVTDVTGVTGVTASNDAGLRVTPGKKPDVTSVINLPKAPDGVTPVTPATTPHVTPETAPTKGVTCVTPVTPQNNNIQAGIHNYANQDDGGREAIEL